LCERFGGGGTRLRRLGLVAVARKLLMALWRFVETGELPEGVRAQRGLSQLPARWRPLGEVLVEATR